MESIFPFLTLVDDFTRYTWIIFLKTKDQLKLNIINFVAYIENQFHTTHICLRSNHGTEILNLAPFLLTKGILHHKSYPETPHQNGVVEIKHQHILNVARSLHFHYNALLSM